MKKSAGIVVGAVVAVAAIGVGGAWYTGNQLPSVLDESIKQANAKITAILDWAMARIGDHHHELAWTSAHSDGHYAEDGKTFLVGGFMSVPEFLDTYQKVSGLAVDPKTLYYYRVYIGYVQGVISVSTTYRIARNGKTHQDVLQAWIMGYGYKMMDDLRVLLEQGA